MGRKVHPYGFRLGYIKDWKARWYAEKEEYADLLAEDLKIRKLIRDDLGHAGISDIEIERFQGMARSRSRAPQYLTKAMLDGATNVACRIMLGACPSIRRCRVASAAGSAARRRAADICRRIDKARQRSRRPRAAATGLNKPLSAPVADRREPTLSLIHISEPTRRTIPSRMPSSA